MWINDNDDGADDEKVLADDDDDDDDGGEPIPIHIQPWSPWWTGSWCKWPAAAAALAAGGWGQLGVTQSLLLINHHYMIWVWGYLESTTLNSDSITLNVTYICIYIYIIYISLHV